MLRQGLMTKLLNRGFTLIEVLFTAAIIAVCVCGLLLTYMNMFILADLSRDYTLATNTAQARMEEIKKRNFSNLSLENGLFNLTDYGFPSPQSSGSVNITENFSNYTNALTRVKVSACFRSRARTIGDSIVNCTRSPVEAVTFVADTAE